MLKVRSQITGTLAASFAIASIIACPTHVFGQNLWGNAKNKNPAPNPSGMTAVPLSKAVDLPSLPAFTGHAKFDAGNAEETSLGHGWYERFSCKESTKDVYNWYYQVLQTGDWKVTHTNSHMINAKTKEGHTVSVIINPSRGGGGFQSMMSIGYFVPKGAKE